ATFMETTPKVRNEKIVMSGIKIARITCMVEGKMYSEDLKLEVSGNVVFLLPDSTQATEGTTMMVIKSDPQWQIVKSPVTLVGQLGEVLTTPHVPEKPVSLQMWEYAFLSWKNNDYKYLVPHSTKSLMADPNWRIGDGLVQVPHLFQSPHPPSPTHIYVESSYSQHYGGIFIQEEKKGDHYVRRVGTTRTAY
ncbi:hypothetical protein OJ252_3762, partial [Cryptosporidium canis]